MAKKITRSFGMDSEQIKALAAEFKTSKKLPNPYRTGAYHFLVAALVNLGVDKFHTLEAVHVLFAKESGREWYKAWTEKKARNKNGKDANDRFLQNLTVLQRTKDYAMSLIQLSQVIKSKGVVIDLTRDASKGLMVRLNTNSATPMKAGRTKVAKPAPKQLTTKATKTAKPVAKTTKPVAKTSSKSEPLSGRDAIEALRSMKSQDKKNAHKKAA